MSVIFSRITTPLEIMQLTVEDLTSCSESLLDLLACIGIAIDSTGYVSLDRKYVRNTTNMCATRGEACVLLFVPLAWINYDFFCVFGGAHAVGLT